MNDLSFFWCCIEFAISFLLVQNSTLTATTSQAVVLCSMQVTLTPGVELQCSWYSQTVEGQITGRVSPFTKHVQLRTASYLVPEKEHDVCPPTSTQLISTNKAYDGNPPAMSVNCWDPHWVHEGATHKNSREYLLLHATDWLCPQQVARLDTTINVHVLVWPLASYNA